LRELHLGGGELHTNVDALCAILTSKAFVDGQWTTATLDGMHAAGLDPIEPGGADEMRRAAAVAELLNRAASVASAAHGAANPAAASTPIHAADAAADLPELPEGCVYVYAPVGGPT
jgi:hypothetical protein